MKKWILYFITGREAGCYVMGALVLLAFVAMIVGYIILYGG